jgi:hypothetical protein
MSLDPTTVGISLSFRVGGAAERSVGGDARSAKETRGMTRLEGEF